MRMPTSDILFQEVSYAVRSIRNAPLFSLIVIGTLAIGIGLTTTFFGLVNTAYYHPLPYRKADQLVTVARYYVLKQPVDELRKMTTALSALTAYTPTQANVSGDGTAVSVSAVAIDSAFFRVLGESPILGRVPTPSELANREPVVVLGERLWNRIYGSRPDIVGKPIMVEGKLRRVVGVMPAWFTFPQRAQVWFPFDEDPGPEDRWLNVTGELAAGKTFEDVQKDLVLLGARLHAIDSSRYRAGRTGGMLAAPDMVSRGKDIPVYRLLAVLVVCGALAVLMIGCTNIASLMLARAARRRGQMVIRASLGASQWQLVRQQLIESTILASVAGVTGILLSIWGTNLVVGMMPPITRELMPGWVTFGIDGRVLAFAVVASLATVVVFGLWPAREGVRFDLTGALRGTADQGLTGRDPTRRVHLPVVLELTFSLALVISGATMLQSFRYAANAPRGFAMDDRYEVRVGFDQNRDSKFEAYTAFLRGVRANLQSVARGADVALASRIALVGTDSLAPRGVRVAGEQRTIAWEDFGSLPQLVSDNYFRLLEIQTIAGRTFDSTDVSSAASVIVVSKRFADEVWPGQNALGKQLHLTRSSSARATVIGVVSDVTTADRRTDGQFRPTLEVYLSERQAFTCCNGAKFIVHTTLTPPAVSSLVRSQLTLLGRNVPPTIRTMREANRTEGEMFGQVLSPVLGTFALAAFVLATIGIYGVVAFGVERRVREMGVRIALGATDRDIVRHLMTDGTKLVVIGTLAGLAAAAVTGRLLSIFVVGPVGGRVLLAVGMAGVFAAVALVACYLPARRSGKLDPMAALRTEG
jgi:putative ABC transport system permease protein